MFSKVVVTWIVFVYKIIDSNKFFLNKKINNNGNNNNTIKIIKINKFITDNTSEVLCELIFSGSIETI